jgi:hypothetical protein
VVLMWLSGDILNKHWTKTVFSPLNASSTNKSHGSCVVKIWGKIHKTFEAKFLTSGLNIVRLNLIFLFLVFLELCFLFKWASVKYWLVQFKMLFTIKWTKKTVYNDHPWSPKTMAFVGKWYFFRGNLCFKV